jgi:catechol 2,3-dioxygenase-like lactoylglutathione lyase family enzyme
MTTATTDIGLRRLQHLVLWVADVERSLRFYRDGLEFEICWTVPGGTSAPTRELDLEGELAQRGIRMQ